MMKKYSFKGDKMKKEITQNKKRIKYLLDDGSIEQEDVGVVSRILGDTINKISLLDLTTFKHRYERKWLKACESDNLNRMELYDGFVTIVKAIIDNWGSVSGEQYRIM